MRTVIIFCLCLSAFAAQAQNDVNYTYMDSLFQQLPEVLVKGERPVVKAERGKLVYDLPRMVERLPVNNAYEAVKELPGIVEQDGNLTLGGRSITLVVNGKVSTLDKDDLKSVLQNTPVSRLEKAEIMYAAPARYRIRGAMVNVVLKSNIGQKPSWSGEVAAMYEQSRREDIAGRGNLLYTSRRFSADVMYSYGFKHTTFGLDKQSWHTMAGDVHELDLKTEAKGYGGRHNLRLGADYDFGKKNLLSVWFTIHNTAMGRTVQKCVEQPTVIKRMTVTASYIMWRPIINLLLAFRQEWISFFSPIRHRPFWRKICRMSAGH